MKRFAGRLAVAACIMPLCACAQPPKSPGTAAAFAPSESRGTILTADLDQSIESGKNVLWCASFQIAWNELMDVAGGKIVMAGDPPLARSLNRRAFGREVVDPRCLVARCGRVRDGIIPGILADLQATFGSDARPELLPNPASLDPTDLVAYAYLQKLLPFETAFRSGGTVRFPTTQAELAAFGIPQYDPAREIDARRGRQVRILWHRDEWNEKTGHSRELFIVELKPRDADERILLAKVDQGKTLAATINAVLQRAATPNALTGLNVGDAMQDGTASKSVELMKTEELTVPVLDLKLRKRFTEIEKREIFSPPAMQFAAIERAEQLVRFRLDEKGAAIKSEAVIVSYWGGPPRQFVFDQPFLLMLIRKGASMPYLAIWVGNHELMVPAAVEPPPPTTTRPAVRIF